MNNAKENCIQRGGQTFLHVDIIVETPTGTDTQSGWVIVSGFDDLDTRPVFAAVYNEGITLRRKGPEVEKEEDTGEEEEEDEAVWIPRERIVYIRHAIPTRIRIR